MKVKTYRIWETITKIGACALFAASLVMADWIMTLITFIAAISIFIVLRLNVRGLVEDERSILLAQRAKRFSYSVGNFVMAITGMVLVFTNRNDLSGTQAQIGYALFFTSFGIAIINDIAYYYFSHKLSGKEEIENLK
jgi:uncharacterized membrane protein